MKLEGQLPPLMIVFVLENVCIIFIEMFDILIKGILISVSRAPIRNPKKKLYLINDVISNVA